MKSCKNEPVVSKNGVFRSGGILTYCENDLRHQDLAEFLSAVLT